MLELIGEIPVWTAVGVLVLLLVAWIVHHAGPRADEVIE
jgi:hypothetical protein